VKSFDNLPEKRLDQHLERASNGEREELKKIWGMVGQADELPSIPDSELDRLWASIARQTTNAAVVDRPPARLHATAARFRWKRPLLVVCMVAGILWSAWSLRFVTAEVGPGERAELRLPDGSLALLNSGSTIRYPRWFLGGRELVLEGEAFFDVSHDAGSPFRISTFNASIEVLGTRFNVRARGSSSHPATVVSLQSGRVRMRSRTAPLQQVEMAPGDIRSLTAGSDVIVTPAIGDLQTAISWLGGDLLFTNESLAAVLEEVGRRYGIELALKSENLAQRQITFSLFGPKDVEQVVQSLSGANGLRYRETAGGYELYEATK
jgi:transmembrane sensor